MADLSTGGGGGGAAYTYVQNAQPSGAEEGESWYDTGANAAYVYDGASWIEQTVAAHSDLSGVSSSNHHSKPTGTGSAGQVNTYNSSVSVSSGSTNVRAIGTAESVSYTIKNTASGSYTGSVEIYGPGDVQYHSVSKTLSGGQSYSNTVTFSPPEQVSRVYLYSEYASITTQLDSADVVAMGPHSHNI